ncbi:hypothetical protein T484DRAFT_1889413, partial [Baffinella frigidus]
GGGGGAGGDVACVRRQAASREDVRARYPGFVDPKKPALLPARCNLARQERGGGAGQHARHPPLRPLRPQVTARSEHVNRRSRTRWLSRRRGEQRGGAGGRRAHHPRVHQGLPGAGAAAAGRCSGVRTSSPVRARPSPRCLSVPRGLPKRPPRPAGNSRHRPRLSPPHVHPQRQRGRGGGSHLSGGSHIPAGRGSHLPAET